MRCGGCFSHLNHQQGTGLSTSHWVCSQQGEAKRFSLPPMGHALSPSSPATLSPSYLSLFHNGLCFPQKHMHIPLFPPSTLLSLSLFPSFLPLFLLALSLPSAKDRCELPQGQLTHFTSGSAGHRCEPPPQAAAHAFTLIYFFVLSLCLRKGKPKGRGTVIDASGS